MKKKTDTGSAPGDPKAQGPGAGAEAPATVKGESRPAPDSPAVDPFGETQTDQGKVLFSPQTESIPSRGHPDLSVLESATESLDLKKDHKTEHISPRAASLLGGSGPKVFAESDKSDTEEVFVILPEEDQDTTQLPVVETVAVEESAWESGPTTTEVLKDFPSEAARAEAFVTQPIEDIPLKKVNPLTPEGAAASSIPGKGSQRAGPSARAPSEDSPEAAPPRSDEDRAKVIDEIADIASGLDSGGPAEEKGAGESPAGAAGAPARKRGSRRLGSIFMLSSIAAAVLGGVFFYPDLEKLYHQYLGGGEPVVAGGGSGYPPASAQPGAGQNAGGAETGNESAARGEFRKRVELAMRVGLSAQAGKE